MEKGIERWIKTSIGEWINTDGLESVIKIRFQDTEFSDVAGIVSETIKCALDNDIIAVNSMDVDMLYVSLTESAMKHSEKTFNDVISELRLLHDTMMAGITRTLA